MEPKTWRMLENNPDVMNELAARLGLSLELQFYDVYDLEGGPDGLAHIPRPALALLAIVPLTPAWDRSRRAEDARPEPALALAPAAGPDSPGPVLWFPQTIGHACGSIGLLHSVVNGPAAAFVRPGSDLAALRRRAQTLDPAGRAALLYDSAALERAHRAVEGAGDSRVLDTDAATGHHFVSFVQSGGRLWELEGARAGPLDRGPLAADEDVLSSRALDLGLRRIMRLNADAADADAAASLRFSCLALARRPDEQT